MYECTVKLALRRYSVKEPFVSEYYVHDFLSIHVDYVAAQFHKVHTVMRIIKLKIFPVPVRLHSGYGKLIFVIISPFFAIFKNVVHSLEPGETPSYSESHQAPKNQFTGTAT